ncbi:hypothetical protein HELRODRAFT_181012 [Helobdella robusta]|uniref:Uncharacterized protein n=1 Tax=Helobdella robusta TaxID=6412 RepID=T1FGI9_HELRO|nr:hypothetical protein HELRODRAFT_181012 [Helobdella robusta]ESN93468.1 hypothetical protein HELRODRAFT_181012 [Helobdella robusta]
MSADQKVKRLLRNKFMKRWECVVGSGSKQPHDCDQQHLFETGHLKATDLTNKEATRSRQPMQTPTMNPMPTATDKPDSLSIFIFSFIFDHATISSSASLSSHIFPCDSGVTQPETVKS